MKKMLMAYCLATSLTQQMNHQYSHFQFMYVNLLWFFCIFVFVHVGHIFCSLFYCLYHKGFVFCLVQYLKITIL